MKNLKQKIKNFISEEEGLTTVEYAVAGAVIATGVLTAFTDLGTAIAAKLGVIAGVIA